MRFVFLTISILAFSIVVSAQTLDSFFSDADMFFKSYVQEGRVNYTEINKNQEELEKIILHIKNAKIEEEEYNVKKAFYINAYNILVINQIVQNYPISSPMDVTGFFKVNKYQVAGKKNTLDYLENNILRKKYADPRLHFVLVCGAVSCPPITNFAYLPSNVDGLMDMQTRKAINNEDFIYEKDGFLYISEIFKWFAEDFGKETDFINKYKFKKVDKNVKLKYYNYNWTLNNLNPIVEQDSEVKLNNNQIYTPGSLLKKGQIDFTLFNNVYTENRTNWAGVDYSGYRTTFAGTLVQFTYGNSGNARINLGVDINIKSSGTGPDSSLSAVFKPLSLDNSTNTRFGIASIAPKIKLSPFRKLSDFTLQSSFAITLPKSPEGDMDNYWIEWDRHVWWNQFFYSKSFSKDKFQLFVEGDLLFRFNRYKGQGSHLDIPASVFFSYFPNSKITLYAMSQHTQRTLLSNPMENGTQTDWVLPSNFTASGIGTKYQVNSFLIVELLYTNFWRAENAGFGETFNLGIKYIR